MGVLIVVADQKSIIKAVVFDVAQFKGQNVFKVLKYKYSVVNNEPKWEERSYIMAEKDLVKAINQYGIEFINVQTKNDRVIGRGAALNRFSNQKAVVIGVMTINGAKGDKVIGYRIVTRDGTIRAMKLADVIKHADNAAADGIALFQNAIYVPGKSNTQTAFLRAYTEGDFIVERHIYTTKAKQVVDVQNVQTDLGGKAKTTKSINEIYTEAQLKELRIGKKEGLPIRIYANPKLQAKQMAKLRMALEKRINPQRFASPQYSPEKMQFFTVQLLRKNRINEYLNPEYDYSQLIRLAQAVELGLDVQRIKDPKMTAQEMDDEIIHMELEAYRQDKSVPGQKFSEKI